jgi:outer membrane receptor for ferrienterochelin and colicin
MNKIIEIFVFLIAFQTTVFSQTGIIRGKVIDNTTGEELIGATIIITGTTTGTITDFDGNYTLSNLEPGNYSIACSFVSFETQTVTDVVVETGNVTLLNFNLNETSIDLEEVKVVAKSRQNTEAALMVLQRKSATLLDGISSRQISRLDDSDAASALKRVTGVTIESGKYVYVRGLGDRYSKTALNGAEIPGLDPNRNTVQMDLFPANLIENMIINKTFSPDLPGSFTGGYVNIVTKDFPERFTFQFSNSFGYNPQANLNNQFLLYEGGKLDWLGIDDGTRVAPEIAKKRNFPDGLFIDNVTLDNVTRSFNKNFIPCPVSSFLNHSHALSLGNQISFLGKPLGIIASLTYSRSYDYYKDGITGHYDLDSQGSTTLEKELYLDDERGDMNILWGGILSISYKLNNSHKVGINLVRNQSGKSTGRYQEGYSDYHDLIFQNRTIQFLERSFTSYQLKGENYFEKLRKLKIDWISSFTLSKQNEPDLRFFQNALDEDLDGNFTVPKILPSGGQDLPARYYRDMWETNWDNKIDFEIPFSWQGRNSKLRFGGSLVLKERDFNELRFDFKDFNNSFTAYNGDIAKYLSDNNIGENPEIDGPYGLYVMDLYQSSNNYTADQTMWAGYLMVDMPVIRKLRMITGFRIENNDIYVISENPDKPAGKLNNNDILPALNLTYSVSENMNIRMAYTKTLAYPSYRELAPFASFDYLGGFIFNGNPDLKRSVINNFDLRWEYFLGSGEMLALSGFYKLFKDPIEQVFRFGNDNVLWDNVSEAKVFGFEAEVRKSLDFVDVLKNLQFSTNFSYVHSQVDISPSELEEIRAVDPDHPSYRNMFGQAPYILNSVLSYNNTNLGLICNLGFNIAGEKIAVVGKGGTPNIMEQPFPNINFNISKTINKKLTVKFSVFNLLDTEHKKIYSYLGRDYNHELYTTGRTFKLSIKYLVK